MKHDMSDRLRPAADSPAGGETVRLYPGITLRYVTLTAEPQPLPAGETGAESEAPTLVICYCRGGHIGWRTGAGNGVCLGPCDFSVYSPQRCPDAAVFLPMKHFDGLTVSVDLHTLTQTPPELLVGTGITGAFLYDKFCRGDGVLSLTGDPRAQGIFEAFYDQPAHLRLSYQRMKAVELLLYLSELTVDRKNRLAEYRAEQIEVVRRIHRQLTEHMEQRFTIEELSKQYLMNPTTLKAMFKSVYGTSIAAHLKEHRMAEAARLLRETELSVAAIAGRIGYESQSRFTTAFKAAFGSLPKEYRKRSQTA